MSNQAAEGHMDFAGHKTWYRTVGEAASPDALPLLCLHGGPGATWHHMEPYEALADERRVIFYDQLGCGNSAVGEPHEARARPTAFEVGKSARDPRPSVEHQADLLLVVLHEVGEIACIGELNGAVLQVLGHPRVRFEDDLADPA